MKVAVLSDIHGNLPALETVVDHIDRWRPDFVIVNGDVINRGPEPLACWQLIESRIKQTGWQMTRGNHEDYVLEWANPRKELSAPEREMFRSSLWTYHQLHGDVADFGRLPDHVSLLAPDGSELRATHASMQSNSDGFLPWHTDEEIRPKIAPAPALFVTGHTHRFFTLQIDDTLLVNEGAVGCPFDGDTRTGYAQLTWHAGQWQANLIRLEYDRDTTYHRFKSTGFLEEGGPLALMMYLEWHDAKSHMPIWGRAYAERVRNGELAPHDSVQAYLKSIGRKSLV
jgi:predicted phosphodiesterase